MIPGRTAEEGRGREFRAAGERSGLWRGDVWQRQEGNAGVGCTEIWGGRIPFRGKNKDRVSG